MQECTLCSLRFFDTSIPPSATLTSCIYTGQCHPSQRVFYSTPLISVLGVGASRRLHGLATNERVGRVVVQICVVVVAQGQLSAAFTRPRLGSADTAV